MKEMKAVRRFFSVCSCCLIVSAIGSDILAKRHHSRVAMLTADSVQRGPNVDVKTKAEVLLRSGNNLVLMGYALASCAVAFWFVSLLRRESGRHVILASLFAAYVFVHFVVV